jgi:protein SCO1
LKYYGDKFGSNPKFKVVAVTLNPEEDTLGHLKTFAEAKGMTGDTYWVLTGDGPKIRGYMKDEFKLPASEIPEKERSTVNDRWNHKLAIVLIDHNRHIRRTADFGDLGVVDIWKKQLERDIATVLDEADKKQ